MIHSPYVAIVGYPIVAAGMFIVSLAAFYYGGMFEWSMRSHTAHQLMVAHFLIAGYLFASSVVGVDPGQFRPPYPMRMVLIMVVFAYHAFFSVSLMASTTILAGTGSGSSTHRGPLHWPTTSTWERRWGGLWATIPWGSWPGR